MKKNFTLHSFFFFLFFCCAFIQSQAQLGVALNPTAAQIGTTLAGAGATVSNISITCPNGSFGTFSNGGTTNLGMSSGLLLTSGSASQIAGAGSSFVSGCNGTAGDSKLDGIAGATTEDACLVQFDIVPSCATLQMSYVFGSEEYPEYVGSGYNDAFGFFVSGTKPSGGSYSNFNIATVPGTGTPVTINSINSGSNSGYYVNNQSGSTIAYDAFTTVLTATISVVPCNTYHMTLVIADGGDCAFDSGVFLDYKGLTCPSPVVTAAGATTICPGQSATLTASGMTSYTWTPGGMTGSSVTVSPTVTTTYTVNALQGVCNTSTDSVIVTVNPGPPVSVNSGTICSPGSIVLTASGATTYSWAPATDLSATTGASVTANPASTTTYTVTGTTAGCQGTATSTVTVTAPPTPTVTNTGPFCETQTIQLNAAGGTTYNWSGPGGFTSALANPTISAATTAMDGVYSVTVSIGTCSATATTSVTINPNPVPTSSNTGPYCEGATISLSSGGGDSYSWSGPNTFTSSVQNPSISSSATSMGGIYTVTVTLGTCSLSTTTNVVVNALPVPTASNTGPYCPGNSTQLNASGGGTYSWSGPNSFSSALQNPSPGTAAAALAGIYTVTVTLSSCTAVATTTIDINPSYTPTISSNSPICDQQALNLVCSDGASWSWSGPAGFTAAVASPVINPATSLNSGVYTINAADANGCTGSASITVFVNPKINLAPSATDVSCGGNCDGQVSVTATGGTAPYSYSWTNGCMSSSCSSLCGGTYSVTVTDAATCTATATSIVVQTGTLVATISSSSSVTCNGYCDGTANATATGGTAPYVYSWNTSPVQATALAGNLCPGTYVCTISDTSCTPSGMELVPNGDFSSGNTGFTSSYAYTTPPNAGEGEYWVATGPDVSTWNGGMSSPGDHTTGTGNFMIVNGAGAPNSSVWCETISVNPNSKYLFSTWVTSLNNSSPAQLQFSINGVSVGNIFSAPATSGSWSQFFASWNSGVSTSANICIVNQNTSLGGNDFGLDDISFEACTHPCPDTASVTITEPIVFVISAGTSDTICNGANFTINASGPAGSNFTWTPGPLAGATQNLVAASTTTFTVNGINPNGCTDSDSITITVPPAMTLSVTATPATCNAVCDGQVTVVVSPATGPFANYQYLWNNNSTSSTLSNLCAAPYSVVVTDAAGCVASSSATVTEPPPLTVASSNIQPATCFHYCDGTALITAGGGTAPYNYVWSPSASGNNPATLCAGNYTCTVTDNNGCNDTVQVTITEPVLFVISAGVSDTVCSGVNFTITASGPAGSNYVWTPGPLAGASQNLVAGSTTTFTVNGVNANGCTDSDSITITVPPVMTLTAGGFAASCNGVCDGQAVVLANPTTGPFANYQFLWNNNDTMPSANGLCAGTYSVLVTDGAGCTAADSATVTEPALLTASSSNITPASCNAVCDGSALITPVGGTPPYNYSWMPGATGNNPNTLCAGNYNCLITDNNGCPVSVNITITEPAAITLSIASVPTICIGQTANLSSTPAGGNGGYVFTWSAGTTPNNTQNVTASPTLTAVYNLSVTDSNNCTPANANVTVTVNPPLSVTASNDATICTGATQNMSATAGGGNGNYTYTWATGTTPATGAGVAASPTVTTTYTVTVTDNCGTPSANDQVVITVNPLPVLTIAATNATGCQPVCADFSLTSSPAMSTCGWTFSDGQTALNDTIPHICFLNAGTYGATLNVTDVNGCIDSVSANGLVTVYPVPTAAFSFSPQPTSVVNPIIYFVDSSYGGPINSWSWNFNDTASSTSSLQDPVFTFADVGTYNVELSIITSDGCKDTVVHPVVIDPEFVLFVPNAFSPNGDSINDFFFPKGIGVDIQHYEMWIYDRWGNLIFKTENWARGWDGRVQDKEAVVQQDVYVWKITLKTWNGERKSYIGHVTVVK